MEKQLNEIFQNYEFNVVNRNKLHKIDALKSKKVLKIVNLYCNLMPRNMDIPKEYESVYHTFLNENSGAGSVITNCGHSAHFSCLKMQVEKLIKLDDRKNIKTVIGCDEATGHGLCPECNALCSAVEPAISFHDIMKQHKLDEEAENRN